MDILLLLFLLAILLPFGLAQSADGGRPIEGFVSRLQPHLLVVFFVPTQVVESAPLFRHTGLVSCAVVGIWFFTRTPPPDSVTGGCPQLGYSLCPRALPPHRSAVKASKEGQDELLVNDPRCTSLNTR